MKKLLSIVAFLGLVLSTSFAANAQNSKFLKGDFVKETPNVAYYAVLNLYEKTVDGQNGEKCYGTIEIATQRGVDGYDIVNVHDIGLPGAEPSIDVVNWNFPDEPVKIAIMDDPAAGTITLDDWNKGDYVIFNNLTLKKKK